MGDKDSGVFNLQEMEESFDCPNICPEPALSTCIGPKSSVPLAYLTGSIPASSR
jgi:hypothetical protein